MTNNSLTRFEDILRDQSTERITLTRTYDELNKSCSGLLMLNKFQEGSNIDSLKKEYDKSFDDFANHRTIKNAKTCKCLDHCTNENHKNLDKDGKYLFTKDEILFLFKFDKLIGNTSKRNEFFNFLIDVRLFYRI